MKDTALGILVMVLLYGGLFGIGKAFNATNDSRASSKYVECYTDWDGRANPTICR